MKKITRFKGLYRFLSNFYKSPIYYQNKIYPTAEHLYQTLKTGDPKERERIRQAGHPNKARKLGQTLFLREDWEGVKDNAMFLIVKLKFLQNDRLRKRLLNTGERLLIENNYWHGNYWGNCLCSKCRQIKGRNQLGKILMKTRENLRLK